MADILKETAEQRRKVEVAFRPGNQYAKMIEQMKNEIFKKQDPYYVNPTPKPKFCEDY